jgi:hypothetical protein
MYQGSCLCGSVKFTLDGPITDIIHCHCSLCRKASGSAYATNGFVLTKDLTLFDDDNSLTFYESSPGKRKFFCKACGAPIFSSNSQSPDKYRLRLGVLDSDITERPISHNFITSRANWEQLDSDLPHYERHEPGRKSSLNDAMAVESEEFIVSKTSNK